VLNYEDESIEIKPETKVVMLPKEKELTLIISLLSEKIIEGKLYSKFMKRCLY
jgi:hypothetical protein